MDEPVAGPFAVWIARLLDHALLAQRAAGGDEPLLPLLWGLRLLLGVEQQLPACRAAILLSFESGERSKQRPIGSMWASPWRRW
jgi:hypothetical protein